MQTLRKAELHALWLGDFLEQPVDKFLPWFGARRQQAIMSYRHAADRSRTVWAELFARHLLAKRTGLPLTKLAIERDGRGKPFCRGAGLALSLSHSGHWVACSLGQGASGIDVEQARRIELDIAVRFFRPEEYAYLKSLPPREQAQAMQTYWTLKESYLKYTGEGLAGGLDTPDCAELLRGDGEVVGRAFRLADGASLSACALRGTMPDELHLWELAASKEPLAGLAGMFHVIGKIKGCAGRAKVNDEG